MKEVKETPLMKQYSAIKARYPGALLLFRVGDFYETFGEDAVTASKILNITLTKRANGAASEIALAGFPHHALDNYLPKLVRAGQRVAICDQLEDPKTAIGIVKRGVTELVTPGVSMNDNVLEVKRNNWLSALHSGSENWGIAFLDISTGEFFCASGTLNYIEKLISGFHPSEVLFARKHRTVVENHFNEEFNLFALDDWAFEFDFGYEKLTRHFQTSTLKGFGIEELQEGIIASGAILHYLIETEHRNLSHITSISRLAEEKYVWLDKFTIRNLELVYAQHEGGVPLIDILDQTVTPMGARMLRKWLLFPLKEVAPIMERQSLIGNLLQNPELRAEVVSKIKGIGDLERLVSKIAAKRVSPRELFHLFRCLNLILPIKKMLLESGQDRFVKVGEMLHPCQYLTDKIGKTLREDAPALSNQGGMIKADVNEELDALHQIAFSGKDYLLKIQEREVERTGIGSLKISYNKVFGYYLEVTHANKDKVPEDWIRKQTLTNAERYITPELKEYEEKILNAEDRINVLEQKIYFDLVQETSDFIPQLLENARIIAELDCYVALAQVAALNQYCAPEITNQTQLSITAGRHPVIEKQLPAGESYVPNDILLNGETQQIAIITGPNMAGKSALLRQTALIVLMAQIGSFVPASAATIGVVDKIFTRVGASDNLSRGESTFMVEMTETASILNNLSDRSLILMDEIGRGTSTYDGISIAWAIVEYLHNHTSFKPKTLFATHYHELNQLCENLERVKNFNVAVKEAGNKILFIRKLKPGGSEHSFGIHVASMAGMPVNVVLRANEVMHQLEKNRQKAQNKDSLKSLPKPSPQLSLFEVPDPNVNKVKNMMKAIDINATSPVEALLKLQEIKLLLQS